MSAQLLYVIVDCYPQLGSSNFREFAGAVASCWIREDVCSSRSSLDVLLEEKLCLAGWQVARVVEKQHVTAETYANRHNEKDYYEQALIDGFVTHIRRVERESIGDMIESDVDWVDLLENTIAKIARNGGISMYSEADQQWANGVTSNGNEFLPLWPEHEDAAPWLQHWPGYDLQELSTEELRCSDLLEEVNAEGMWIGVGIARSRLTMCHPLWIRDNVLITRSRA